VVGKSTALGIWMNGHHVGELKKASDGALSFTYTEDWLAIPAARPISLSLPLRASSFKGDLVYNYFDNLLPDNNLIRDRIQARFRVTSSHPFDLLGAIGMDCVGAVQVAPYDDALVDVKTINGTPLSNTEIGKLLNNYRTAPLGMVDDDEDFRISIAGAQEKTALLWKEGQWCRPSGATPTTHIFKLPIGKIENSGMDLSESCENEWLCMKIAEAFGLPVSHSEVMVFDEVKALVVERFDRKSDLDWIIRLPQEDMCQALGKSPNLKYEKDGGPGIRSIMELLLQSRESKRDRDNFYKTQVLFWLLAAIDGHAKNFSLFIEAQGRFQMTPLYDIMSAHPLVANKQLQSQKLKMAMALIGQNRHYHWQKIQPRHFPSTAMNVGFSEIKANDLFDEMMDKVDEVINDIEAQLPPNFPDAIATSIFDGIRDRRP